MDFGHEVRSTLDSIMTPVGSMQIRMRGVAVDAENRDCIDCHGSTPPTPRGTPHLATLVTCRATLAAHLCLQNQLPLRCVGRNQAQFLAFSVSTSIVFSWFLETRIAIEC
jgi:hypothetical protein